MTVGVTQIPERIDYIGHGVIESASPATSVGHVALHEGRHLSEFEARARREGRVVVARDVDIHVQLRGGAFVATSGKATAVLAKPSRRAATEQADNVPPEAPASPARNAADSEGPDESGTLIGAVARAADRIDHELADAKRDVRRAEEQLRAEEAAGRQTASQRDRVAALRAREARLRAERSRLERARAAELARRTQEAARELLRFITATDDVALHISLARLGARRPRRPSIPGAYAAAPTPGLLSRWA